MPPFAGPCGLGQLSAHLLRGAHSDQPAFGAGRELNLEDPIMPNLQPAQHAMSALLPTTEYFEIDSAIAGNRYAVWVNVPPRYEQEEDRRYPAIFTADGNLLAPLTIPHNILLRDDPINPILPFVQVNVGYCGKDIDDWVFLHRNRDLLPIGEPPSPDHVAAVDQLATSSEAPPEMVEQWKKFKASVIAGGRSDLFLRFLTEELYPAITARWRIDDTCSGFFGDSYSGLFAAWVAMQRHPFFTRIGVASPALATAESKVYEMLAREQADDADHSGRQLHLTVGEGELTVPSVYQVICGTAFTRLAAKLGARPLKGLKFSSHIIANESHWSGIVPCWFSFLRACYSAR